MPNQVIHIHPLAPAKPLEGMPCNGCGVCCLAQPCPLGMVLSGARTGPCKALRWWDVEARYVCGAIVDPASVLPGWLQWAGIPMTKLLPRLALRWVAAGQGCDSSLQPLGPPSATIDARPISGVSKPTTD